MYLFLLYKPSAISEEHSRVTIERHRVTNTLTMLCVLISGASWAAPIATNTALPLSADEIIIRQQFVMTHSSDYIAGTRRDAERASWPVGAKHFIACKQCGIAKAKFGSTDIPKFAIDVDYRQHSKKC